MTNDSEYMYLEEIARICRAAPSSVRHWISTGRLPSVRPGRRRLVRRDDFERFLRERSGPHPEGAAEGRGARGAAPGARS